MISIVSSTARWRGIQGSDCRHIGGIILVCATGCSLVDFQPLAADDIVAMTRDTELSDKQCACWICYRLLPAQGKTSTLLRCFHRYMSLRVFPSSVKAAHITPLLKPDLILPGWTRPYLAHEPIRPYSIRSLWHYSVDRLSCVVRRTWLHAVYSLYGRPIAAD